MKKNIIKQSIIAAAVTLGLSAVSISTVYAEKAIAVVELNATPVSMFVRTITKTMSDSTPIDFWVFCKGGTDSTCATANRTLPSPTLAMTAGTPANVTLNMIMAPQEDGTFTTGRVINDDAVFKDAYIGHTIHLHGLDMESEFDGVPETYQEDFGGSTKSSIDLRNGFDYLINSDPNNIRVDTRFVGSHMYHCHVHTIKHLEMGMYGAFVVKSEIDPSYINNTAKIKFDDEWIMMISTVDPKYHTTAAQGDNIIFSDYNPKYFLVNGEEGDTGIVKIALTKTIKLAPGQTKNIVIRLMGIHSTNATFSISSGANNQPVSFTVYNKDGFALITPKVVTSVELSPGQTKDVMLTVSGAATYTPQIMFTGLRDSTKPYNETYPNSLVLKSIVKTKLLVLQQ